MMNDKAAVRRQTRVILFILPVIMAGLILGGVFLGFYMSDLMGTHSSIVMPLIFATVGLFASIGVALIIVRIMLRSS
jgi:hypothetical protein